MYQKFVSISKQKMFKSINKSNIRSIKVLVESKTAKVYKYIILRIICEMKSDKAITENL